MNKSTKIAVLFPGIGYTCDKPLLYYTGKLAVSLGYELLPVPYGHFPPKVKGDKAKMRQCFESALLQSREILKEVSWADYEDILFVGKSVGTIVAAAYASQMGAKARFILFTPLEETFSFALEKAVSFHGTKDPWADTEKIISLAEQQEIPLYLTEQANHSMETGDVLFDVKHLYDVMKTVEDFILT